MPTAEDLRKPKKPGPGTVAGLTPLELRIFNLEEKVDEGFGDLKGAIQALGDRVDNALGAAETRRAETERRKQDRNDRIVDFLTTHLGATCAALTTWKGLGALFIFAMSLLFLAFGYGDDVVRWLFEVSANWGLTGGAEAVAPAVPTEG